MAINVLIDDYLLGKRSSILFTEMHVTHLLQKWNEPDPLLIELQKFKHFKDKTKLSELDLNQFKMLISTTFTARDLKIKNNTYKDTSPIAQSLNILILGLAYCMQLKSGVVVDTMKLMRINDNDISFEFVLTMISEKKKVTPNLSIVIDNTPNDKNN